MKAWIVLIYFFSQGIFFGTLSLFNQSHNAGGQNFLYFNLFLAVIVGILGFYSFLMKLKASNYVVPKEKVLLVCLVVFLLLALMISFTRFTSSVYLIDTTKYFIAFAIPGVILALSIEKKDVYDLFNKLKYVNIYLTFCFALAFFNSNIIGVGIFHNIGGANHLLIGYTMSALFSYNLLKFISVGKFRYKFIYITLMLFNISLILISGSRGAIVSVVAIFVAASIKYLLNRKRIFYFAIISITTYVIFRFLSLNQNFSIAFERLARTFNLEEDQSSSERVGLYKLAIDLFKENPVFGNGIGSFSIELGKYYYPHNILLELLNDFGIFGLLIFITVLAITISKCLGILKLNFHYHLIVFLFLNTFTQLIFTGSYLTTLEFWVTFSIIMTFPLVKRIKGREFSRTPLHLQKE